MCFAICTCLCGWCRHPLEPMTGIEPAQSDWKSDGLPLTYIGKYPQPDLHRSRGFQPGAAFTGRGLLGGVDNTEKGEKRMSVKAFTPLHSNCFIKRQKLAYYRGSRTKIIFYHTNSPLILQRNPPTRSTAPMLVDVLRVHT